MRTFYFTETIQREYFVEADSLENAYNIVMNTNFPPYDEFSEGISFVEEVLDELMEA